MIITKHKEDYVIEKMENNWLKSGHIEILII